MLILHVTEPDRVYSREDYYDGIPTHIRGVYLLYSNDQLLYIGKSNDLRGRVRTHLRTNPIYKKECTTIKLYFIESQVDMDIYETYLINLMKPLYNKDKIFLDSDENKSKKTFYEQSNLSNAHPKNRYKTLIEVTNKANERLVRNMKKSLYTFEDLIGKEDQKDWRNVLIKFNEIEHELQETKRQLLEQHDVIKNLQQKKVPKIVAKEMQFVQPESKEIARLNLEIKQKDFTILKQSVDMDLLRFEKEDSEAEAIPLRRQLSKLSKIKDDLLRSHQERERQEVEYMKEKSNYEVVIQESHDRLLILRSEINCLREDRERMLTLEKEISILKKGWLFRIGEFLRKITPFTQMQTNH